MSNIHTQNKNKLIYIFSCRIAKNLIQNGFRVIDIFPNEVDRKRTVFAFLDTPALREYLKNTFSLTF